MPTYRQSLEIELHFAEREEKAYRAAGETVNAERWHMAAQAFQRCLDLLDLHAGDKPHPVEGSQPPLPPPI